LNRILTFFLLTKCSNSIQLGFFIFITILSSSIFAQSQNPTDKKPDILFVKYLIDNEKYADAFFEMKNTSAQFQNDTILYLKGYCFYKQNNADSALFYWQQLQQKTELNKSALLHSCLLYLNKQDLINAKKSFDKYKLLSLSENEILLQQLFEVGFCLAQKEFAKADSLISNFKYDNYNISDEQNELKMLCNRMKEKNFKSPLLAATLSTIFPGVGKFYTGKNGGGFGAAIVCTLLGTVALESALKVGILSVPFFLSAGLFSAFYIGNIVGSYYSAKQKNNEKYRENYNYILRTLVVATDRQFSSK